MLTNRIMEHIIFNRGR